VRIFFCTMRNKLEVFTQFANSLYPHEAQYLFSICQFQKIENSKIFEIIVHNTQYAENKKQFDFHIDKRTYSNLKKWITESLAKVDVDTYYEWLIGIEKQILTDSITAQEEFQLLDKTQTTGTTHYYFIRFYEVLQHYRDYLLIRFRTRYYRPVTEYLEKYAAQYQKMLDLNRQINNAALEIVRQQKTFDRETLHWEEFLISTFYDETLDGYTRYRAVVRLTVLYYNYREFEKLRGVYNSLDIMLNTPSFYSKRILANYYNNRAMMHAKLNEFDEAAKYGNLSVRRHNSDYLFYVVNFCGILLKSKAFSVALKLMQESISELKNTNSLYNKIGFASFYIKTLVANNQLENAVSYGSSFFEAYKKEIFEHRWHLFISSYFQALFHAEKFAKIISISHRNKLVNREKQYAGKVVYLPTLHWFYSVSCYLEGDISKEKLFEIIYKQASILIEHKYHKLKIVELLRELKPHIPDVIKQLKISLGLEVFITN